jgi:hypothetical protein
MQAPMPRPAPVTINTFFMLAPCLLKSDGRQCNAARHVAGTRHSYQDNSIFRDG